MAINFPFEMFMQAQDRKNQNRQQMNQDIVGMGQGLGQGLGAIGDVIQQQKQKQAIQQLLAMMQAQGPMQGPQLPGAGMAPGGKAPSSGMGSPFNGPDPSQLLGAFSKANPQGFQDFVSKTLENKMGVSMNPLQKSEIAKNQAETQSYLNKPEQAVAALEEKKAEADANRTIRTMQQQMNLFLAQGKHDEAQAKLEEMKETLRQRAKDAQAERRRKAQMENAKYWFRNPVTVPPDPDKPGGLSLTPEEMAEFQRLDAKYGK